MEKAKPIWLSEMPDSEFEGRLKKIRSLMKKDNLEAILIYSYPRQFPASKTGFIRYTSNWDGGKVYAPSLVIIQAEHDPTLIISNPNFLHIAKETSWIQDVRSKSEFEFPNEVQKILSAGTPKVGLIGFEDIPYLSYENLRRVMPKTEVVDATKILEDLRMVKSPREMDAMRKAIHLADLSFETFVDEAKDGRWEYQATAKMEYAVKSEGAQEIWISIASGPYVGLQPPNPMRRKLKRGDSIVVTPIVCYKGYWSQTVRTGAINRPSKEEEDLFNLISATQDAAIKSMKPGVLFSDIYKAATDIIDNSKYAKYKRIHFRFGHGIGLDYTERPIISPYSLYGETSDLATKIKTGMTLAIHANLHIPELHIGASIGDTVLVTDKGVELPSKFERSLFVA